jgi:hypothetical protein
VREIRALRAMWRALETGFSLKIYAPALDPTGVILQLRGADVPQDRVAQP